LGLPHEALAAAVGTGRLRRLWRAAVEPFVALVLFNVLVVVTHLPPAVDWLMVSQLGSFALDAAWLAGGLIFWWPLIAPQSGSAPLGPVARIGYLLLSSFIHMGVGIVLVVSRFPLYRVYELAPPVGVLKLDDQQLAGGVMLIVGSLIIATALFILLRQWLLHEEAATAGGGRVSIPPEIHLP
jgi:cytochrome c oxidase assembly factor CtaG